MWVFSFPSTVFLKNCHFPIEWSQHPYQRSLHHICDVYFWVLELIPLLYLSMFIPVLCCFDYCNFVIYFEIEYESSSFVHLY